MMYFGYSLPCLMYLPFTQRMASGVLKAAPLSTNTLLRIISLISTLDQKIAVFYLLDADIKTIIVCNMIIPCLNYIAINQGWL